MDLDHPACSQTWALCLSDRIFSPPDLEKSCCSPQMSPVLSVDSLSLYWSPSLTASVFCSCFQFLFWLALLRSHMNTWNPLKPSNIFCLVYEHNLSKRRGGGRFWSFHCTLLDFQQPVTKKVAFCQDIMLEYLWDVPGLMERNISEGWLPADDPAAGTMAPSGVRQAAMPSKRTHLCIHLKARD